MRKNLQAGEGAFQGIVVLAILLIVIATIPKEGENFGVFTPSSLSEEERVGSYSYESPGTGSTVGGTTSIRTAQESQSISLGSGNASYSYQPYEEYITIENRGDSPVNITGWQLRNGKDKRQYYLGGSLQRFSADLAAIPQALRYLPTSGSGAYQNVVLERGERAIVTTGLPGIRSPYPVTSFKENICSGYLENMPEYAFVPPLTNNCPRPALEPGVEALDSQCRDFISTLSSCQIPRFDKKDQSGEPCDNCVNGRKISSPCVSFIKEHFTYRGCLAYHGGDANFSGRTWRVFLGRGWEMWAEDYESIELFNTAGQLVDFQNY
jgi:hypothetical protein